MEPNNTNTNTEVVKEEIVLSGNIEKLRTEFRELNEAIEKKRVELADINKVEKDFNELCDKKRAELTAITNEISQQRLDWTTEKAQEEAKLDEKKEESQTILAQKEDLAQISVDLKNKKKKLMKNLK